MLNRLHALGCGHVALAGSGAADQHDIIGAIHEVAEVQLPDQGLICLAGGKVEAGQVLVGGEAGRLDLIGDGLDLALGHLGLEQLGAVGHGGIEGGSPVRSTRQRLGHAERSEAAQNHHHGSACGISVGIIL